MVKKPEWYQGKAAEMIVNDHDRDGMFEDIEDIHHLKWELPTKIKNLEWMRKFVSTDPYDALRALTRVLSTVKPKVKIQPMAPTEANKMQANHLEKALEWHLFSAGRRGSSKVVQDIVLSAGRCDEVCAQVVMLTEQAKSIGMTPQDKSRYGRYGPFAVLVRNPRFVHSRFSDWGLEAVVHERVMKAEAVVEFWGDRAKAIERIIKENTNQMYVSLYDYWDATAHAVWGFWGDTSTFIGADGGSPTWILKPTAHDLKFIPWVIRVGGSNLDDDPVYQRQPLLFSVWKAGQWLNENVLLTLVNSEGIAHAAAPRGKTTSADPNNPPQIDYGQPTQNVNLRTGEEYDQLQPPAIDANLLALADRVVGAMEKSTISRVLSGFSDTQNFSALNLVTQSAAKSIAPHKTLAENALADICTQMLYWVDYSKESLTAFGSSKADMGMQYVITPDDFDVDNLYIEVELTADVPTDRMARMNAAAIGVRDLGLSRARGMEEIGIEDPRAEMNSRMYEDLVQNELQLAIQNTQMAAQMKWQALAQQQAMEMQMAQQQAQQEKQPTNEMGEGMQPQGMPGVEGQGFNPAQGGQPPAQVNPAATREGQTGLTRGGQEIRGGFE